MTTAEPPWRLLRRSLLLPLPAPAWPDGVAPRPFHPGRDARAVHALLQDAYRDGGGRVPPFDPWWDAVRTDAEFDPSLLVTVADPSGRLAAAALCWRSAFIKDLAVAAPSRRRGVGEALLLHLFHIFANRGASRIDLKVELANPSGAERLYRRLGFRPVEPDRAALP